MNFLETVRLFYKLFQWQDGMEILEFAEKIITPAKNSDSVVSKSKLMTVASI